MRTRSGIAVSALTLLGICLFLNHSAAAQSNCDEDSFYQVHNENIQKTLAQVKDYTPGSRDYYVEDFNDDENIYLKAALSPGERKEWEPEWQDENMKKCINARLDELAAAADKTIGSYKPVGYTLGTLAEKNILRGGVTDIAKATSVYNVGLNSANWKIVKNDIGIPTERVRYGTLWLKYPNNKYCTIAYVNLVQDYSGGGTYNASQARFISWEFAGCPAK